MLLSPRHCCLLRGSVLTTRRGSPDPAEAQTAGLPRQCTRRRLPKTTEAVKQGDLRSIRPAGSETRATKRFSLSDPFRESLFNRRAVGQALRPVTQALQIPLAVQKVQAWQRVEVLFELLTRLCFPV